MATLAPRILDTPLGPRVGGYVGQYRIRYHFAPDQVAAPAWANDRAVGLRLPPVGDNPQSLRSFTWQLHTYGAQAARPDVPDWVDGPHNLRTRHPGPADAPIGSTWSAPTASSPRHYHCAMASSTRRPCGPPWTPTRSSTERTPPQQIGTAAQAAAYPLERVWP